jgi:hypothetical protein
MTFAQRRNRLRTLFCERIPVVKRRMTISDVKVKQSRYGPGVAQRVLGRFPNFMTAAHDGGQVVGPTHRPNLPPGNSPGTHFY